MSDEHWKRIQHQRSKKYKQGRNREFKQVGTSTYYLSRDKANHADSHFKLFIEKGTTLDFFGSVHKQIFMDEVLANEARLEKAFSKPDLKDFRIILKHDSGEGTKLKKSDLSS